MDLEVVGRHALLFDDDNSASFVNSPDALVEWNSLSIDRYDVRHLLSTLPPRVKRRHVSPPRHPDSPSESELDHERYLDLPSTSPEHEQDNGAGPLNDGGLHAVPFSYGNTDDSTEQKNADAESGFRPPFSLPESLLQNLMHGAVMEVSKPPSEKVHQIIARTAMFVSKHGGQSEIVLRVKQGDNPTFGFLMPAHHLHAYFRFLVDHPELLSEENKANSGLDQTSNVGGGGALSLLGSVYGSGEDEDGESEDAPELKRKLSDEAVAAVDVTVSNLSEQTEPSVNIAGKDETVSKHSLAPLKEKAPLIKKNQPMSTVKTRTANGTKKGDTLGSLCLAADKSEASALPRMSKVELPVLEPPSDMKRAVDKIVEFILRNGKEFEAVLVEQDRKYGRFPFLLPSNLYYSYYLKVLHEAEESKLTGKSFTSEKHDSTGLGVNKKNTTSRESDMMHLESDIPYDSDRKEKFKMTIGKSKKDASDIPSKPNEPNSVVTVDAAAAAAILQAATRGIRNPNLECLTKMSGTSTSQGPGSEGGQASGHGSLLSWPESSKKKLDHQKGEPSVSVPVASAIAKSAAVAAGSEADSSEAGLTREQKLKAERLKRAKMFAAMMKNKAEPVRAEPRCLSVEPPESGFSGSVAEVVNLFGKEREGSSVPFDADTSEKNEKSEKKDLDDDLERRSKRKYRSRSTRNEEDEEVEEELKVHKHSKKKHRSHRSSHQSRERKRHSSSKDKESRHSRKHDSSSDNEHQDPRHQHKHDSSDDEHRHSRHRHKHYRSSNDELSHSRHRDKHYSSSDDEHRHRSISQKHRKRSHSEREVELEEGEIKSDQSKASEGGVVSREASVDVSQSHRSREASVDLSKSWQDGRASSQPSNTNEVSDDLRAKIRAMLMATL